MSLVSRYLDPALVEHLNHMELSARSVVSGATIGQHRSPVRGASVEFRQHRFYVPGDEPRRLDWRVLGRTDRPYVKEYDEETNLRAALLLDASGSMNYGRQFGSKFDYSARIVAALAYLMLGQTESVGIAVCAKQVDQWLAPHSGAAQLSRIIDLLERSQPAGETGIASAMHQAADRLERRALVIVVSDFFAPIDELRLGLAHLRHERHEVICLQVVDRDEEDFPFRTWTSFRGMESEGAALVEPALARKTYQDNFLRHRKTLASACAALKVEFQALTTERPTIDAIRSFLKRRPGAK